jgi:probable F420-dependent oxidoreductase
MKIGACVPNYGQATGKEAVLEISELAEKLGFHSIWTTDHLLIPSQFSSPYGTVLESIATASFLAGKVKNMQIGTSVIVLPMREVVLFAKQAAAIQILSESRLILGLGAGWNETEFRNVRSDFKSRGQYYDEAIQLFRWLLKGNAEFKGDFYSIEDGVFDPIPKEDIPLLIGGDSGASLRRAAKLGDGWFPVGLSPSALEGGRRQLKTLNDRKMIIFERLGVIFGGGEELPRAKQRQGNSAPTKLSGSPSRMLGQIEEFRKAGLEHLVCYFDDLPLSQLKIAIEKFGKEVMPSI